jgi:hypothetical protein
MDQDNLAAPPVARTFLGRKSWVAYAVTVLRHALLLLGVSLLWFYTSPTIGMVALLLILGHLAYRILELRSYELFLTEDGVWVFSGILPWTKGVSGVKWRDLDEAVFYNSLVGWATRSYSIRIGHRFTKASEIFLSHIFCGQKVVSTVNDMHRDMVRSGAVGR